MFYRDDDKNSNKRITDSRFRVEQGRRARIYHMECESKPYDGTILVRIFEYAVLISKEDADAGVERLVVTLPESGLLLLRTSPKAPKVAEIKIVTPGGEVSYQVPIVKATEVSLQTVYEKKLYFLLPFFIFQFEDRLDAIATDGKKVEELVGIYVGIREHLENEALRMEIQRLRLANGMA